MSGKGRFGHIPAVMIGDKFDSYATMHAIGLHNRVQGGISGVAKQGAESIVISGGYEDDQDFGNEIIYTGQGGRNESGKHVSDQQLERGNQALVVSEIEGLPLRVIRGADRNNKFAPEAGYRYDGLFRVESHWWETGKSGFKVWRFRLLELDAGATENIDNGGPTDPTPAGKNAVPVRVSSTVQRIVRDTALARYLKYFYRHKCQVCGTQLESAGGPYIEAAHIRALGRPHDGPDDWENIICLCPNHHVMFDLGIFSIADDFSLIGIDGNLNVKEGHIIDLEHLAYHREHFLNPPNKTFPAT